jgi:hypothetical protein
MKHRGNGVLVRVVWQGEAYVWLDYLLGGRTEYNASVKLKVREKKALQTNSSRGRGQVW